MKRASLIAGMCFVWAVGLVPARGETQSGLTAESFRNPSEEARPWTWWHWQHGLITKEGITADLEAMRRIGLGGAMAKVLARLPSSGRSMSLSLIDSYEKDGQNWTDGIVTVFTKRRGYDPTPFLAVLTGTTVDSPSVSERFTVP